VEWSGVGKSGIYFKELKKVERVRRSTKEWEGVRMSGMIACTHEKNEL